MAAPMVCSRLYTGMMIEISGCGSGRAATRCRLSRVVLEEPAQRLEGLRGDPGNRRALLTRRAEVLLHQQPLVAQQRGPLAQRANAISEAGDGV
jgi:hypothetical protein